MGFFDKIKAAVGIGNPKIEFTLEGTQVTRGTAIKGTITLTGGSRDTPVKSFIIEHIEIVTRREWSDSLEKMVDRKVKNTIAKHEIQKAEYNLKPGEVLTENFELQVAPNAKTTQHPYAHEVKVSADVPGLDPNKRQDVYII